MENRTTSRRITDTERNSIIKLFTCGCDSTEIAEIMHLSKSSVLYVRQAHNAAMNQDRSTLQRLSNTCEAVVRWAMKATGADKTFEDLFKEEPEPAVEAPAPVAVPEPVVTREDFFAMYAAMQDIRNLLIEIRDILK